MQLRPTALCSALFLLAGPTLAQSDYVSTLDSNASSFTWSGSTSLGPIVGNPDSFNLVGSLTLRLTPGATQPVGVIKLKEGNALVSPDISGEIPNPVPFLPPLATLDIATLALSVSSTAVPVAANGDFSTTATFTALSGSMTVDVLGGSSSVTDLTGLVSDPTPMSGNLGVAGGTIHFASPVNLVFQFTDAGTGVSGTVTLVGSVVSDYDCAGATNFCSSSVNSTGNAPAMSMGGSTSAFANDLVLQSADLPNGQPGIFYYGPNQIAQAFGNGTRCVGGTVVRLAPVSASATGQVSQALDNSVAPNAGLIVAGSSWNFQFWYRDPAGGGSFFNLTDGLSIPFCP